VTGTADHTASLFAPANRLIRKSNSGVSCRIASENIEFAIGADKVPSAIATEVNPTETKGGPND
jgi:hypothetical protein